MSEGRYGWLKTECAGIRATHFHVFSREPAPIDVTPKEGPLREFLELFGNARLYRSGGGHRVGVHWPRAPDPRLRDSDRSLMQCGWARGATLLVSGIDASDPATPRLWRHDDFPPRFVPVDGTFDDWLRRACTSARRLYTMHEWREQAADPTPFDERELAIVAARSRFLWSARVLRRHDDQHLVVAFEVRNTSDLVLAHLTVWWRSPSMSAGVWLDVSGLLPGERTTIEQAVWFPKSCDGIEFFAADDPLPETRDRYWEFGRPSL